MHADVSVIDEGVKELRVAQQGKERVRQNKRLTHRKQMPNTAESSVGFRHPIHPQIIVQLVKNTHQRREVGSLTRNISNLGGIIQTSGFGSTAFRDVERVFLHQLSLNTLTFYAKTSPVTACSTFILISGRTISRL